MPGKFYYYTTYDKTIIVASDGDFTDELRTYLFGFNRFILCDNNEKSIRAAITEAKAQLEKVHYELVDQLDPEYMARKF